MAEYLAPGVYVEETSFRAKSIEGVGTSTSAFVGLTLKGPTGVTPDLLTSFADFERVYGGLGDLVMGSTPMTNYMAYAVQAYFANGGSRLYVSRVSPSGATNSESTDIATDPGPGIVKFNARFPGEMGNGQVTLVEKSTLVSSKTFHAAPLGSILRVKSGTTKYFLKQADNKRLDDWQDTAPTGLADADLATPPGGSAPTLDLITLMVVLRGRDGNEVVYDDLGYSPNPECLTDLSKTLWYQV
jgi:uncharacterized protein